MVDFNPIKASKFGELAAHFEIVLGRTPDERLFLPKPISTR
jgi:protocatechuate 3,4-dioxygenase beta subunit